MNKKSKKNPHPKEVAKKEKRDVTPLLEKYPWLEYALVTIIIAIFFFIRRNFVGIPMERDEGSYALYGKLLMDGAKPYLGFYEMKPPGIFIAYGLMVKVFGFDLVGLQKGFCYVFALILLFTYLFMKNFSGRKVAMAVLPVYGFLLLNQQISGFTIQAEYFVLLFVVAGLYLFSLGRIKNSFPILLCSGIVLGFSVLIKQAGIFYCAFAVLWLLTDWFSERNLKKFLLEISAFALGGTLIVAGIIFWLQMDGVTKEAWFWIVEFPSKYYLSSFTISQGLDFLWGYFKGISDQQLTFWIVAGAGLLCGPFLKISIQKKIAYYSFILFSFLTIVPGLRFYGHYWILFMPGVAVGIAMTYQLLDRFMSGNFFTNFFLIAVFIAIPVSHFASSSAYYTDPNFDKIINTTYGGNPFNEAKILGDYLNRNMKPGDGLFVVGSEPEIYLYAHTTGISRHSVIYIINMNFPFAKTMRDEAIKDVETKKPRYIVVVANNISWWISDKSVMDLSAWSQKYVQENYNPVFIADQVTPGGESIYKDLKISPNYALQGREYVLIYERK